MTTQKVICWRISTLELTITFHASTPFSLNGTASANQGQQNAGTIFVSGAKRSIGSLKNSSAFRR
jgi:hypothetical protein